MNELSSSTYKALKSLLQDIGLGVSQSFSRPDSKTKRGIVAEMFKDCLMIHLNVCLVNLVNAWLTIILVHTKM